MPAPERASVIARYVHGGAYLRAAPRRAKPPEGIEPPLRGHWAKATSPPIRPERFVFFVALQAIEPPPLRGRRRADGVGA